ncbi:MAG TPA: acyl carrier protein [Bryobacteraceae bacterium]|nr:acyl carrier protein [Bryobacteraceae bacterium]
MTQTKYLVADVQTLLSEQLMLKVESPDTDLLKTGMLDSLRLVELLFHLEEQFGVRIPIEDLDTEDLRSVHSIAELLTRQQARV